MTKRLFSQIGQRLRWINIGLATGAYIANEYFVQGFCQPVTWAAWVLLLSLGAFLAWPWLCGRHRAIDVVLMFGQGVGLVVCLYCSCFDSPHSYLLFAFLIFPVLGLVPILFATQIGHRVLSIARPWAWVAFSLGLLPLLAAQVWAIGQFRAVEAAVYHLPATQRQQIPALLRVIPRTYMAERLAGAYFKYHNYPEFVFDGWRPPLHDPLVNVCLWLRGISASQPNPLTMMGYNTEYQLAYVSLDKQAQLYHRLFPAQPRKVACSCARIADAEEYFDWHPEWNVGTPATRTSRGGLFGIDHAPRPLAPTKFP